MSEEEKSRKHVALVPIAGVKNWVRCHFQPLLTGLRITFSLLTLTSLLVR
jgi:hypothetical protein